MKKIIRKSIFVLVAVIIARMIAVSVDPIIANSLAMNQMGISMDSHLWLQIYLSLKSYSWIPWLIFLWVLFKADIKKLIQLVREKIKENKEYFE